MALGKSLGGKVRRSRCPWYRPRVEILEDRTLLSFLPPVIYTAGSYPYTVQVGDFNGDGNLDLAVANDNLAGTVSLLLGNGDGTFKTGQSYSVGSAPLSIAVGDFNGDGNLDLAVANHVSNTVSVLLGNGDGTFQSAVSYSVGTSPSSVAVGDFNGGGQPDLAITHATNPGTVSVLLGNGDGSFQAPKDYPTGAYPSVAVGDVNGDGIPDLVTADEGDANGKYSGVSVLLGNGDGTFQAPVNYTAGLGPFSVVLVDFTGDGTLDLAVADFKSTTVSILLGNGDGTFQAAQRYTVGSQPLSIGVGDFNGDGTLDLAVANEGTTTVSVLLGNGDGSFQAHQDYTTMYHPTSVAVGDFNGDGFPDLVTTNYNQTLSVLLNAADWDGGPLAVPGKPRLPARRPAASSPLNLDPLSAQVAAHDPQALRQLPPTSTDQPPNPVPPMPVEADRDHPAQPEATANSTPLVTAPPAQDAVLEHGDDLMMDGFGFA